MPPRWMWVAPFATPYGFYQWGGSTPKSSIRSTTSCCQLQSVGAPGEHLFRSLTLCGSNSTVHTVPSPTQDNIFEWHFTIAGPPGTSFEGGRFHGRMVLPVECVELSSFRPDSSSLVLLSTVPVSTHYRELPLDARARYSSWHSEPRLLRGTGFRLLRGQSGGVMGVGKKLRILLFYAVGLDVLIPSLLPSFLPLSRYLSLSCAGTR